MIDGVAVLPGNQRLVATGNDRLLRLYDIAPEGRGEIFAAHTGGEELVSIDISPDGGDKGVWTRDISFIPPSFFLAHDPYARPTLAGANQAEQEIHQQLGWMRGDASVETAGSVAANNVNLLVETVILNYMALNGEIGLFPSLFTGFGASPSAALLDSLTAFGPLT